MRSISSSPSSSSAASPARRVTGFAEKVPPWATLSGAVGSKRAMIRRLPPTAPTGNPPPITLPSVTRSGRIP